MYNKGEQSIWEGRKNPESVGEIWHQTVKAIDINKDEVSNVCFLGFCSDVGVKRNLGRIGAVNGPDAIRRSLLNLAVHFDKELIITDGGNIVLNGGRLEKAQIELANYVSKLFSKKTFPILLGGGHEISYGHIKGVLEHYPNKKIGTINFDPHLDLRSYPQGAHSGSWARQLFDEYDNRFQYLPLGINPAVNIASMFDLMKEKNQSFISMDELLGYPYEDLIAKVNYFLDKVDKICITMDLDVFSSGIAPGVSSVNPYGLLTHHLKPIFKECLKSEKVVSFDIAEMNPEFDDGRTAKLAASFIYDAVMSRNNQVFL